MEFKHFMEHMVVQMKRLNCFCKHIILHYQLLSNKQINLYNCTQNIPQKSVFCGIPFIYSSFYPPVSLSVLSHAPHGIHPENGGSHRLCDRK